MISSAATSSALYAATSAQGKPALAGASLSEKPIGSPGLAFASPAAGAGDAEGASDGAAVLRALSPLLPALPPKEALLVSMSSGMLAGGVNPSALEKSGIPAGASKPPASPLPLFMLPMSAVDNSLASTSAALFSRCSCEVAGMLPFNCPRMLSLRF